MEEQVEKNFRDVDWSDKKMDDCRFVGCELSGVKCEGSQLNGVVFKECKLVGIPFFACSKRFFNVSFDHCLLIGCQFGWAMEKGSFKGSVLENCDFQEMSLKGANFSDCVFKETRFHHCDLRGADFRGARNYAIDLRTNEVEKALFSFPEAMVLLDYLGVKIER